MQQNYLYADPVANRICTKTGDIDQCLFFIDEKISYTGVQVDQISLLCQSITPAFALICCFCYSSYCLSELTLLL